MPVPFRSFALGAALLAGVAFAPLASAQLIQNGGFESAINDNGGGVGNWTKFNNGSRETPAFALEGTATAKLFGAFFGNGTSGIYQNFAAAPGQQFSASGFGYNLGGDEMRGGNSAVLRLTFIDASGNVILGTETDSAPINANTTQNVWTALNTPTATAPAGAAGGRVFLLFFQPQPANEGGAAFFDSVSVSPVPEPASLLAMGAGLAGLLARRRRR